MLFRGKGWVPDDAGIVQEQLSEKSGTFLREVRTGLAPVVNYTSLLDLIPDQGPTSSCVGQAFSTALYLTAKLAGHPIERPSAKAIYDFARMEDQPHDAMTDTGSRPFAAVNALNTHGMVANGDWPILFDHEGNAKNINTRPPLHIYQNALGAKLDAWYRIAKGPEASTALIGALARGYCPIFAMPVDEAYERWDSEKVYEGRFQPSLGNHMQAIAGYDNVNRCFLIVSSWGSTHGHQGIVRIGYEYMDSGEPADFIVPTVVPTALA